MLRETAIGRRAWAFKGCALFFLHPLPNQRPYGQGLENGETPSHRKARSGLLCWRGVQSCVFHYPSGLASRRPSGTPCAHPFLMFPSFPPSPHYTPSHCLHPLFPLPFFQGGNLIKIQGSATTVMYPNLLETQDHRKLLENVFPETSLPGRREGGKFDHKTRAPLLL